MPDDGLESRAEALFQEALDRAPEARASFIREASGHDDVLRLRVERLLEHVTSLGESDETRGSDPMAGVASGPYGGPIGALREGPGAVIGRYKLLQRIGEGGFGVVYMAEQTEPVTRKVALKIIKLGMDTREVVARFEAERQALALMEHEHIARVLDGGTTASGRPYFVMELVRGVSITEYCDANNLATRERLVLFDRVCSAVQHAHQKGVIHRDLKPSNVLVTLNDGEAVPKVIDFGVAKAMHGRLTDKTLFTRFEQFVGTPTYMSPEQAQLSSLDVDTRTDIYSLGVLLYELLTGTTPFSADTLREAGLAEVQRVIREETAPRPSLRISTSGDAAIARSRRLDLPGLSRALRGDLDWIVMKSLEKERARRYQSAGELAEDVRRHLALEPVRASPPSRVYAMRRFVARNRALAGGTTLALAALLVAIVAVSVALVRAERSAVLAEQRAEHNEGLMEFLLSTLSLTNPEIGLNPEVSVRTLLDDTASRVPGAFEGQPWSEVRVRSTIGTAYASLGQHTLAEPHLRRAVELADHHGGLDESGAIDAVAFGAPGYGAAEFHDTLWTLTNVSFSLERPDAYAVAARASGVGLRVIGQRSEPLAAQLGSWLQSLRDGAWSNDPGVMDGVSDRFDAACRLSDAALAPDDPAWSILSAMCLAGGYMVWYTPHEQLAERFWSRALEIQRRTLTPDHPETARTVQLLVGIRVGAGRFDEAESLIRDSLDRLSRVHPDGTLLIATGRSALGEVLTAKRAFKEAESLLVPSHDIIVRDVRDEANFIAVESLLRLIGLYEAWGRDDEAEAHRLRLVNAALRTPYTPQWVVLREAFGPARAPLRDPLDRLHEMIGGVTYLSAIGTQRVDGLHELLGDMRPALERVREEDPDRAAMIARLNIGWANGLDASTHASEREQMASWALGVLGSHQRAYAGDLAETHSLLASAARERADASAARTHAIAAWEAIRQVPVDGMWFVGTAKVRISRVLIREGLLSQAEQLLAEAAASLESQLGAGHADAVEARTMLRDLRASTAG